MDKVEEVAYFKHDKENQLTKIIWEKGTKNAYFQNEVVVILDIEVASINSIR